MFNFFKINVKDEKIFIETPIVIANVTYKDHSDIHYLYKLRKALVILLGEENVSLTEDQISTIHAEIVRQMLNGNKSHWYEDYYDGLDQMLPDDLKQKSDGYVPEYSVGIFDLSRKDMDFILKEISKVFDEKSSDYKEETKKIGNEIKRYGILVGGNNEE